MPRRQIKTLDECTTRELIDELASRCTASVILINTIDDGGMIQPLVSAQGDPVTQCGLLAMGKPVIIQHALTKLQLIPPEEST